MTKERYFSRNQARLGQKSDAITNWNQIKGMAEITDEFLRNTSIHGMRYIGQRNRPVFERILWLSLVIAGCSLSVWMCFLEWNKWNDSSILITRDPTLITHNPIRFPVVTMCSTNKISKKKLAGVLREPKFNWMNFSTMVKTIRYMTKFVGLLSQDEDKKFKKLVQELIEHDIGITDLIEVISQVSPTCSDLVVDCQWKSNSVACGRIMSLRLTDDGYCCSLDVSTLDDNSDLNRSASTVYDYGVHSALRLILDPNLNDNALSTVSFDGFKVLLHNKDEFADVTERGFIVGSGYENFIALNSFSVSYTPAVEAVSFERRQCHTEGEGGLKYSQSVDYTRSNCLFECRAEKILEVCHCLPYFITGVSVPTCSLQDYPCVINFYVRAIFMTSVTANCTCPATCKDQWFTTEISSAPLSPTGFPATRYFKRIARNRKMNANYSLKLIGLRIFFKYNAGESFSMDVPFGNKELLASVGGILGLGLGFSIISAIELCYFLCCGWYFRKKRVLPETVANSSIRKSKSISRNKLRRPPPLTKVLPGSEERTIAWLNTVSK